MTALQLEHCTLSPDQVWYLDTSALIALTAAHFKQSTFNHFDKSNRGQRIQDFAARVNGKRGRLLTTMLAVEELAGVARAKAREIVASSLGMSWNDLKQQNRAKADQLDVGCRDDMLKFMTHAANTANALNISHEFPLIDTSKTPDANKKIRKSHRELLRLYSSLDAMDALHIVFGKELGADHFVSFDKGWHPVAEIHVGY